MVPTLSKTELCAACPNGKYQDSNTAASARCTTCASGTDFVSKTKACDQANNEKIEETEADADSTIIIAAAAGNGGALFLVAILFLFYRRRSNTKTPANGMDKATASKPPATKSSTKVVPTGMEKAIPGSQKSKVFAMEAVRADTRCASPLAASSLENLASIRKQYGAASAEYHLQCSVGERFS